MESSKKYEAVNQDIPNNYAADNLKDLRIRSGMSRAEFIKSFTGTTRRPLHATTLKRLEEGSQQMKVDELIAFCGYFDVSVDDFVSLPIDPKTMDVKMELHKILDLRFHAHHHTLVYASALLNLGKFLESENIPPVTQSEDARELQSIYENDYPLADQLREIGFKLMGRFSPYANDGEG